MRVHATLVAALVLVSCVIPVRGQDDAGQPQPCSTPQARQFDFWIGQWEVTQDGETTGFNAISSILGGCVIFEEFSSANGSYSGKSFNYYDEAAGKWHQVWVDTSGLRLHLTGGFGDGKMVMSGERMDNGRAVVDRITWQPNTDGSVRQLWEASRDKGKTWEVLFDGLYTMM